MQPSADTVVLVTGATGTLGREVVAQLDATGRAVRGLSRRAQPASRAGIDWAEGDLRTGMGLGDALRGVAVIIHCATGTRGDLDSAKNLLAATQRADSLHLIYISIVGVDRVPLGYYQTKLAVERLIEQSGTAWTILRATQFHDLVLGVSKVLAKIPVTPVLRDTDCQPIDAGEVAQRIGRAGGRTASRAGARHRRARSRQHG